MTTITPVRAAAGAAAAALAVAVLGVGAGYAWGSNRVPGAGTTTLTAGSGGTGLAALPAAFAASGPSTASGPAPGAGITVSGTGTVSGTPDTLRLSMGVSVTSGTVTAALDGASGAAGTVMAALKQHGVADKDVQTSNVSVQPQYAEGTRPVITGYQVTESLTAVLRDVKAAGAAISAAATAGGDATRVDGVSLDLSDSGALVTAARTRAFEQAKAKASQYAQAAGAKLGGVLAVSEVTTPATPMFDAAIPTASAARSVPIAPGSVEVGVTVTVVFGLG